MAVNFVGFENVILIANLQWHFQPLCVTLWDARNEASI